MEEPLKNEENKKDSMILLYVFFALVISLWLLAWYFLDDIEERGTFGDMFGSVNALFSGLALAGIIFTILLQKKELKLQRLELSKTRNEFKIQNDTLRMQRFENTLFQMIANHHQLIDKLSFTEIDLNTLSDGKTYEKREVFEQAVFILQNEFRRMLIKDDNKGNKKWIHAQNISDAENHVNQAYNEFYVVELKQMLNHYFRNIYHVFKFIYKSKLIGNSDKKFYSAIVRAQLSPDELFLILYNSLIPRFGYPNFLFLIKEMDILQNFDYGTIGQYKYHDELLKYKIQYVKPDFEVNE